MVDFDIIASGFEFSEAPRVADDGSVYFSDLTGGGYYCCTPDGHMETIVPDRLWIGGAVLNESDWVICRRRSCLRFCGPIGAWRALKSAHFPDACPTAHRFGKQVKLKLSCVDGVEPQ
jgi:hypothetical protein